MAPGLFWGGLGPPFEGKSCQNSVPCIPSITFARFRPQDLLRRDTFSMFRGGTLTGKTWGPSMVGPQKCRKVCTDTSIFALWPAREANRGGKITHTLHGRLSKENVVKIAFCAYPPSLLHDFDPQNLLRRDTFSMLRGGTWTGKTWGPSMVGPQKCRKVCTDTSIFALWPAREAHRGGKIRHTPPRPPL